MCFFLAFYGFIDRTAEDMTRNRKREREREGEWHKAKGRRPGVEPTALQSLGTWDARSTNWTKRRPRNIFCLMLIFNYIIIPAKLGPCKTI